MCNEEKKAQDEMERERDKNLSNGKDLLKRYYSFCGMQFFSLVVVVIVGEWFDFSTFNVYNIVLRVLAIGVLLS